METEPLSLTFQPLCPENWHDFEALFEKHRGVRGGCWCVYYLCKSTDYNRMGPEGRRAFHRELALSGRAQGLIAYEGETPVGWCQFGKPDVLSQYDRGRTYPKLSIAPEDKPSWRISCLFTDKHRRSRGIAIFTLHAALEEIARAAAALWKRSRWIRPRSSTMCSPARRTCTVERDLRRSRGLRKTRCSCGSAWKRKHNTVLNKQNRGLSAVLFCLFQCVFTCPRDDPPFCR